jgi:hypothetical protein
MAAEAPRRIAEFYSIERMFEGSLPSSVGMRATPMADRYLSLYRLLLEKALGVDGR